jgi:hypothetical protein
MGIKVVPKKKGDKGKPFDKKAYVKKLSDMISKSKKEIGKKKDKQEKPKRKRPKLTHPIYKGEKPKRTHPIDKGEKPQYKFLK